MNGCRQLATVLLTIGALTAATAAQAGSADGLGARLGLVQRAPLVVRGSGFPAGSRVLLTGVRPDGSERRWAVTRRDGTFVARFTGGAGPCAITFVRARAGATRATLRVGGPAGACQPPPETSGPPAA